MPQRTHSPRLSCGFTLLEIMVVIVIIGIMASVAMISIGVVGRDRDMQDQAERIEAVINQAREECELQGFDVGLRVGTNSYDFLRFDARQQLWLPVVEDDLFGTRELSEGLRLRLWLEGREVVLKEQLTDTKPEDKEEEKDPAKKEIKKEPPPHIMILSSGDLNSFDLQFEREGNDTRWHVFSKPDGTIAAEQILENT